LFDLNLSDDPGWFASSEDRRRVEAQYAFGVVQGGLMLVGLAMARTLNVTVSFPRARGALKGRTRGLLDTALLALLGGQSGLVEAVIEGQANPNATHEQDAHLLFRLLGYAPKQVNWAVLEKETCQAALALIGLRLREWSRHAVAAVPPDPVPVGPAALQLLVRASKLPAVSGVGPLPAEAAVELLHQATYYRCADVSGASDVEERLVLGDALPEPGSEDDVYVRLDLLYGSGLIGEKDRFGLATALSGVPEVHLRRVCGLREPASAEVLNRFEIT
jgi:hypothetical protein